MKRHIKICFFIFAISFFVLCDEVWAYAYPPTENNFNESANRSDVKTEVQENWLQDVELLIEQGKLEAGIYMLQQLEKADPENYEVLFKLGELALSAKNWAYAIQVLRKASLLRPDDITVRLILLDIYTTYRMSIQEIIVAKEILSLDPQNKTALEHSAKFYQDRNMLDDEIEIRRQLQHLFPDDYQNLKRLADIFYENGELWESARIYEQIRKYYPERIKDIRRLAAIYDELEEGFRKLQILDHIAEQERYRGWMHERTVNRLRLENDVYDPFRAGLTYRKENTEELDIASFFSEAKYVHTFLSSSFNLGLYIKHSKLQYSGKGILDGDMNINSGTVAVLGVKNWQGQDYELGMKLGIHWDSISGELSPRDPASGLDRNDFPFLKDPTFSSYGGSMPVGDIYFLARSGYCAFYQVAYEHSYMEELDARLLKHYLDKLLLSYYYETSDETTMQLQVDESAISDGNYRFHALASAYYTIWGKNAMYDYLGRRRSFFRQQPFPFIKTGYTVEYYTDKNVSNIYAPYKDEIRHQLQISGRVPLFQKELKHNIILDLHYAYSAGKSLDFRDDAGVKIFYSDSESGNEVGLSYTFEKETLSTKAQNVRISGTAEASTISVYAILRY